MYRLPPKDVQIELDAVLTEPPGTGIRVLAAPPGSGKSCAAREAVIELFKTGRVGRVLWATRDTRDAQSLGAEALGEFNRLSVTAGLGELASLVLGGRRPPRWSRPGIKIVSHAYLPIIFDPCRSTPHALAGVDLLIVDEDPLDSLLHSSHPGKLPAVFNLAALRNVSSPDGITRAVVRLLEAAAAGAFPDSLVSEFPEVRNRRGDRRLEDAGFYRALLKEVAHRDWAAFEATLLTVAGKSEERHAVPLIIRELRQAVMDFLGSGGRQASRRFGLRWTEGEGAERYALRYDFCRPLALNVPTMILDGYADGRMYRAALAPLPVILRRLGRTVPLKIEFDPLLALDPTSDWTGRAHKQLQHRKQAAEEIGTFLLAGTDPVSGQPRNTVVLTSKELHIRQGRWRSEIEANLNARQPGLAAWVEHAYWMNGRGVNAYSGYDVIAMTRPARPVVHREHNMAAIFPFSAADRAHAHLHLECSELLQMLHRGRQSYHPGARILTAFDPRLPAELASSSEYMARAIITRRSHNARSQDAVRAHAEDLKELLGGVPRLALQGIGLVSARNTTPAVLERARANLKARTKKSKKPLPHLRSWLADEDRQYADVLATNSMYSHRKQAEMLDTHLELTAHTIAKGKCGKHSRQVVYASSAEKAEMALKKLLTA